ncbi:hypothetical protein [Bradyrhizobium cosmicum]|uniref:hypothetical protein n=1 Tax=Bradyrhizobium cosmicum TaxID=1404864 RepID=UPI0028EBD629|nr:hypothetical protein [Bradyrhizobium cosmicum]
MKRTVRPGCAFAIRRDKAVASPAIYSGQSGHLEFRSTTHIETEQRADHLPRAQRRARHAFARLDVSPSARQCSRSFVILPGLAFHPEQDFNRQGPLKGGPFSFSV